MKENSDSDISDIMLSAISTTVALVILIISYQDSMMKILVTFLLSKVLKPVKLTFGHDINNLK